MAKKTKIKAKIFVKQGNKPIRPNMGRGTGGILPVSVRAVMKKKKENDKDKDG